MKFCPNCFAPMDDNLNKCKYCGMWYEDALKKQKDIQAELELKFEKLEKEFKSKEQIKKLTKEETNDHVDSLSKKIDDLYEIIAHVNEKNKINKFNDKFNSILNQLNLVASKLEDDHSQVDSIGNIYDLIEKINELDEKIQQFLPIKNNVDEMLKKIEQSSEFKNTSPYDLVMHLLKLNPPELSAAAFKLRSTCERNLRDKYNYKFLRTQTGYRFEKPYTSMFKKITNANSEDTNKLSKYHGLFNKYVHECEENDNLIKNMYPTVEEQKEVLKDAADLLKKYELL